MLERSAGHSLDAALVCGIAALILLVPANFFPLLSVSEMGVYRQSHLASGVAHLWGQGWVLVAAIVALEGLILPFFRFSSLVAALGSVHFGYQARWVGPVFRWSCILDDWAMADVYLLGCAIGYERLRPYVPVDIHVGGWALMGAAFMTMLCRATLDRRTVWRQIGPPAHRAVPGAFGCRYCDLVLPPERHGGRCPRCWAKTWRRRPHSVLSAAALVTAGFLLYLPANYYPMNVTYVFGHTEEYRIIDGVMRTFEANLYPLGALIFTTSIIIPLAKLVALSWFMLSIKRRWTDRLVTKTRVYRTIVEIGRWSNADVFTITVFIPLMQFHALVGTSAAKGAPAFLSVVVLTMFAERLFDPRLMWDQEAKRR